MLWFSLTSKLLASFNISSKPYWPHHQIYLEPLGLNISLYKNTQATLTPDIFNNHLTYRLLAQIISKFKSSFRCIINKNKFHIENLLNVTKTASNTCATAYREETALTAWHTHTLRQQADNWQMSNPMLSFPCNRAVKFVTILASTQCICLYICSSCLYLSTYMHILILK